MDFRTLLATELARRTARNPRYSMRAFARELGTAHSTVSRVVNGGGRLTAPCITALGTRLGLSRHEVAGAVLHANVDRLVRLVRRADFTPDARWIATRSGLTLNDVQVALHYLIYSRRLVMRSATTWTLEPA